MSDLVQRLSRALPDRVETDATALAAHRRDSWMLSELHDFEDRPAVLPLAVVLPESTQEAAEAVRLCREARAPIVPYGGGSGVCGAVLVPPGAVVLSTRRLEGLVDLDERDLLATFRAGTLGMAAERRVQRDGLTIGHWPQSIEQSTVGGWVATRAAGQFSTAYGSAEDLVLALEAVLPDGSVIRTRRTPRASAGPDLRQLLLGSEGTLGLVTEVTFSLRPLPEASRGQAFHFAELSAGIEAVRKLMRAGWRPPVVRLYDAAESARHFPESCPGGRSLLILLHEGPTGLVEAQIDGVARLCDAGVAADPACVDQWLERRNQVPGFREFLERGVVVDTIEVACTWSQVEALYERVTAALSRLPGMLVASAHSSHSYRSGTSLYFTFAARPEDPSQLEATYLACWRAAMDACVELGAGISHHHGIGRVRRDVLTYEIGASGVALLRAVKRALDPEGLWNPGTLIPPG